MTDAIQMVAKIVRWGKRSGGFFNASTGMLMAKVPSYKSKSGGNSRGQPRSDAKLLVEQAMGYGYLNGKRMKRK